MVLPQQQESTMSHLRIISPNLKKIKINSMLQAYQTPGGYSRWYNQNHQNHQDHAWKGHSLYGRDLFEEVYRYAQAVKDIMKELVKDEDFDIIHAHDWLTYKAGIAAQELSGKPLIVHVHATEFDRTGGNGVHQQVYDIEKEGMEKAEKVIAVSNFTKRKIMEHYGINAEKISVVHNAVSLNGRNSNNFRHEMKQGREQTIWQKREQEPGKHESRREQIVLFLGRITLQKGPDYFISAAKKVLEQRPDTLFVMTGSGDMEGQIIQQIASWNAGDKVLFTGFLKGDDVDRMYQMADVYVMPSVSEPFGITPLEAMRNDVPVIISKQSGVSEVISHCLKVDFWDIDETANKIIAVLDYPELNEELARNGKQEVCGLDWSEPAQKCLRAYACAATAAT